MGSACGTIGGEERCMQSLVVKPDGKRPPGKPRRKWEDNMLQTWVGGHGRD